VQEVDADEIAHRRRCGNGEVTRFGRRIDGHTRAPSDTFVRHSSAAATR
jgi:hypothetical protein